MKKITVIIMALALMLGMTQCRKDVAPVTADGGEGVYVTLTAGIGGGRTEIGEHGLVQWSSGDKLYAVGSTQGYLGALTTVNYTTPSATATFAGVITAVTSEQNIHFYYVGKSKSNADFTINGSNCTYSYSIASQGGTLGGIANTMHLMHGVSEDVTASTLDFGTVAMHNMIALAKFDISGYSSPAKCNAISSRTLNLNTGRWNAEGANGNITLNNPTDGYYMALIPSASSQTLTFRQGDSDASPVALTGQIDAGRLYTDNGASIAVTIKETDEWVNFNNPSAGVTGLPLWAKKNIGATNGTTKESWYGHYYAWGEVEPYYTQTEWCEHPSHNTTITFNPLVGFGWENYLDGKANEWDPSLDWRPYGTGTTLEDAYDAARTNWGGEWRMPTGGTTGEWKQLTDNTYMVWATDYNDVSGLNGYMIFRVKNADHKGRMNVPQMTSEYTTADTHIFLPASGFFFGTSDLGTIGSQGGYCSKSLCSENVSHAHIFHFVSGSLNTTADVDRYVGVTIRPVRDIPNISGNGGAENFDYTDVPWGE